MAQGKCKKRKLNVVVLTFFLSTAIRIIRYILNLADCNKMYVKTTFIVNSF